MARAGKLLIDAYLSLQIYTLQTLGDPLMILAMAADMLYRRGGHAHSGHTHAGPAQAEMSRHGVQAA